MPALQPGFDGPAGRRAARSPSMRHRAHQTERQIHGELLLRRGTRHGIGIRDQPQHQRIPGVGDDRPSPPLLRPRSTRARRAASAGAAPGLVAAGNAGAKSDCAGCNAANSSRMAMKRLIVRPGGIRGRAFALLDDRRECGERCLEADDGLRAGQVDFGRSTAAAPDRRRTRPPRRCCSTKPQSCSLERRVERADRLVVEPMGVSRAFAMPRLNEKFGRETFAVGLRRAAGPSRWMKCCSTAS